MSAIVSPCVNLCTLGPETELCAGCGRTIEEIACWQSFTHEEREAIMRELSARLAADAGAEPAEQ